MAVKQRKKVVDSPVSTMSNEELAKESFEETPFWVALVTMLGYGILFVVGHIRDFLRRNRFEATKVRPACIYVYTHARICLVCTVNLL